MLVRHRHLLEKLQVQLTAAAALVAMYFGVWHAVSPWNSAGPMTFVPTGSYGELGMLAAAVLVLAAAVGLLTTTARPEGAVLAAVIGAGGVALRSPQMRGLLWERTGSLAPLYQQLMLETAMLGAVMLAAILVVGLVRGLVAVVRPGWVWRDPVAAARQLTGAPSARAGLVRGALGVLLVRLRGGPGSPSMGEQAARCLGMAAIAAGISGALVFVLLQSPDRGQVLFALLAATFVGMFVAHQVMAVPCGIVAWVVPLGLAMGMYALSSRFDVGTEPQAWTTVPFYARALPIDWMTAGLGGGFLGYWLSERLHESKALEEIKARSGQ
jgi:hypothetical protein